MYCTYTVKVSTGRVRMRAGPSRAELGPNIFNRAELFLNSLTEPDHQSFKDPGQIQLKDQLKNSKFFLFFKISYLIFSTMYIICL